MPLLEESTSKGKQPLLCCAGLIVMPSEKLIHKGMDPILELCQQNLYQKVMLGKVRLSEEQSSQFNTFLLQSQIFLSLNIYK